MSQTAVLDSLSENLENDPDRADSRWPIVAMILASALALFGITTVRHYVMRSGAFDLGFFDQALYLISRGHAPISSLLGFHVLGDHASVILYPLALFYLIWPNVHMLLIVQAIALSAGAWPVYRLGMGAGLTKQQALAVAGAYLTYPIVLTASIFDFHPDSLVVIALLMAILSAREEKRISFCLWIAVALSCKEVMALTVIAMGAWLIIFERRKFYGIVAIAASAVWFVFSIKFLIPYFGHGRNPSGVALFSYLGNSVDQIILTMILHPGLVLKHLFVLSSVIYLLPIVIPVIWGFHYKTLAPLIGALPAVTLNMLSSVPSLRSIFFQYSLPVVPFVFVAVIAALSRDLSWLRRGRTIIGWSLGLFVLAFVLRVSRIHTQQAMDWTGLEHTKNAIAQIDPDGRVLTTFETVPYLSHRSDIQFVGNTTPAEPVDQYDYFLINTTHSSLVGHDQELANDLAAVRSSPSFHLEYSSGNVYLFQRNVIPPIAAMR
jgi:uncharacterized membrane protein